MSQILSDFITADAGILLPHLCPAGALKLELLYLLLDPVMEYITEIACSLLYLRTKYFHGFDNISFFCNCMHSVYQIHYSENASQSYQRNPRLRRV